MSDNPSREISVQPLSIGNIVSASIRLYRSHLKDYFLLAMQAYGWLILPILVISFVGILMIAVKAASLVWLLLLPGLAMLCYGLAKYYTISALISRLAFAEITNKPESISTAIETLNPRVWSFFNLSIKLSFWLVVILLVLLIVALIIAAIIASIFTMILGDKMGSFFLLELGPLVGFFIGVIAFFIMSLIILFIFTWVFSRWIIAEVPLAVEENITAEKSISRSWELTANSVLRIQAITLIGFLVTLPLIAVTDYLPRMVLSQIDKTSTIYLVVYLISVLLSALGGAVVLPFWQTTKALLYYDLRNRKEGFGLQLQDRNI